MNIDGEYNDVVFTDDGLWTPSGLERRMLRGHAPSWLVMPTMGVVLMLGLGIWTLTLESPVSSSLTDAPTLPPQPQTETPPSQRQLPPLQVFLLAGQSNMEGHGIMNTQDSNGNYRNGTLEWMVKTFPDQYGKLKKKLATGFASVVGREEEEEEDNAFTTTTTTTTTTTPQDEWSVREDVWITYNRQSPEDVHVSMNETYGSLTPGYGGNQNNQEMGPELGFGWTMAEAWNDEVGESDEHTKQQILLIKVAWGGRSLAVDYRPPSSGGTTGLYYEAMMADTLKALNTLDELFPAYDKDIKHYKLAGFVWHQGWNDGCFEDMTNEYESNLANLIRDVRQDLGEPKLPVAIADSGMIGYGNGVPSELEHRYQVIEAQHAVSNATRYPEFAGTVSTVRTQDFYRPVEDSPGNQIYHWNNNCESYWLVGEALGKAMLELLS